MSQGAVLTILINNGRQDRIILAMELLEERINQIRKDKCEQHCKDINPTLIDIEKSHIVYVNAHFKPFVSLAYEYNKVFPNNSKIDFGSEIIFDLPQYGDFFHDMCVHVKLRGLSAGFVSTQARYCDYLGHRLLKKTKFEVDNIILDEYSSDVYNFYYNFHVPLGKRKTWKRCVGQEVPIKIYLTQNPTVDEYREVKKIVNGPQTPKANHSIGGAADVEMFIPLLFWFNTNVNLSLPTIAAPYGKRLIKILLAGVAEIAQGYDAPEFTAPVIDVLELYVNNIFINPDIYNIFINKIGFSLIRVYKEGNLILDTADSEILLKELKYPTETIFIGTRPLINDASMTDWHKYHFVNNTNIHYPVSVPNPVPPPDYLLAGTFAVLPNALPPLNMISVKVMGVYLWEKIPMAFFNSYTSYKYGENIHSPEDIGMLMMPFCLFPDKYQPSGHVNLTNSREFYVFCDSNYINNTTQATFIYIGISINFLLIEEGSVSLRYSQ